MRGKVFRILPKIFASRITPAYAGKSQILRTNRSVRRDHPRLCGEKADRHIVLREPRGSPPPMRGKAGIRRNGSNAAGITPAYAGKSVREMLPPEQQKDHPRLCGEKNAFLHQKLLLSGSPPPMRGKDPRAETAVTLPRITPAYAGKRILIDDFCKEHEDHPRLCGEKGSHAIYTCRVRGSPPPMRGKVWL